MSDTQLFTVIIGEETGTKVKGFLIAPKFARISVGDLVVAHGLKFRALYVEGYCKEDDITMTLSRVALGKPYRVTMIIKEEPVEWEDSEDVDG